MAQVEVIDKEREEREKENTPEGKRSKRLRICLEAAALLIFFGVVYVINHNPNAKKDVVTVTVQGVEIVPGETKVQEILEAGFSLAEQQAAYIIDPETKAEANSYYTMIFLVKEKKEYGTITMVNDSNTAQEIPKCTVLDISVHTSDEGAEQVMVDGNAMGDLTYEQLVESYGDPASSEETTYIEGTEVNWENKEYGFRVDIDKDGEVHRVQSSKKRL